MPQPATTTCWLPSESSLKRESFNDLVRHRVTNAPMLLMKANVMGRTAQTLLTLNLNSPNHETLILLTPKCNPRNDHEITKSDHEIPGRTAMMAFPAVGDRSHLSTAPVKGSRRRSSSLSSIGMKSLRFSIKSQDGHGSNTSQNDPPKGGGNFELNPSKCSLSVPSKRRCKGKPG